MSSVTVPIVTLPNTLCLRDPLDSPLGKRIITSSISVMNELPFDRVTFKKIAQDCKTTEASIYRYFSHKQQLLAYLVGWYWGWLSFRYRMAAHHESDPRKLLALALQVLSESNIRDDSVPFIDESILHDIVVRDGSKIETYMASIGSERSSEMFAILLKEIISQINPKYKWADTLARNLIVAANDALRQIALFSAKGAGRVKNRVELTSYLIELAEGVLL